MTTRWVEEDGGETYSFMVGYEEFGYVKPWKNFYNSYILRFGTDDSSPYVMCHPNIGDAKHYVEVSFQRFLTNTGLMIKDGA